MRAWILALATLIFVGVTINAQVMSPTQVQAAEERARKLSEKKAEEVLPRARATTLGALNADTNSALAHQQLGPDRARFLHHLPAR